MCAIFSVINAPYRSPGLIFSQIFRTADTGTGSEMVVVITLKKTKLTDML